MSSSSVNSPTSSPPQSPTEPEHIVSVDVPDTNESSPPSIPTPVPTPCEEERCDVVNADVDADVPVESSVPVDASGAEREPSPKPCEHEPCEPEPEIVDSSGEDSPPPCAEEVCEDVDKENETCPAKTFAEAKEHLKQELQACQEQFLSVLRKRESTHEQKTQEQNNAFRKQLEQGMADFKSHYEMERSALKELIRTKTEELQDKISLARRQQIQQHEKQLREATQMMMDKVFELRSEFEDESL